MAYDIELYLMNILHGQITQEPVVIPQSDSIQCLSDRQAKTIYETGARCAYKYRMTKKIKSVTSVPKLKLVEKHFLCANNHFLQFISTQYYPHKLFPEITVTKHLIL